MNVLLIGSGGREHALAVAMAKSPNLSLLYCAPGNAGIQAVANCVDIDVSDHPAVIKFCRANAIELVVIGPEAPLVAGLADDLREADILVFGPSQAAAALEGSKGFTKDLCAEFNIPTAGYVRATSAETAKQRLADFTLPVVIKADGLAAGKGVVIAETEDEALAAIDACFDGAFGGAGAEIVLEDFLTGEEASFFVLVDGENVLPLTTAQDHKRVGDGDTGLNTGGMGAYSPAPVMTDALIQDTMDKIIYPTVEGMRARGTPFQGVLYAGLMITGKGPELIEYNVRFGDPECQVLMARLQTDLLDLLVAASKGLLDQVTATWDARKALCVVMAAKGYPGTPSKGGVITGFDAAESIGDVTVCHAGTKFENGAVVANGGRVLGVTALGDSVQAAQQRAYKAVDLIKWDDGFCRRDIGWRTIKREQAD